MTTLVIAASNGWHLAAEEVEFAVDVEWWAYAGRAVDHTAMLVGSGQRYVDQVDHPVRRYRVRRPPTSRLPSPQRLRACSSCRRTPMACAAGGGRSNSRRTTARRERGA